MSIRPWCSVVVLVLGTACSEQAERARPNPAHASGSQPPARRPESAPGIPPPTTAQAFRYQLQRPPPNSPGPVGPYAKLTKVYKRGAKKVAAVKLQSLLAAVWAVVDPLQQLELLGPEADVETVGVVVVGYKYIVARLRQVGGPFAVDVPYFEASMRGLQGNIPSERLPLNLGEDEAVSRLRAKGDELAALRERTLGQLEGKVLGASTLDALALVAAKYRKVIGESFTLARAEAWARRDGSLGYKHLDKDPTSYRGKRVRLHGRIFNIKESGDEGFAQMNTCQRGSGCGVYVRFTGKTGLFSGDEVTLIGFAGGSFTFTSVANQVLTVPAVAMVQAYKYK